MSLTGSITLLCNGEEHVIVGSTFTLEEGGNIRTDNDEGWRFAHYIFVYSEDEVRVEVGFRARFDLRQIDLYAVQTDCSIVADEIDVDFERLYREED